MATVTVRELVDEANQKWKVKTNTKFEKDWQEDSWYLG